jgi:hypothetical protein
MTSRPLFISVELSTVILGPIDQVGMGQGVLDGHDGQLRPRPAPERPARGGEDDLGHPLPAVASGDWARRHWWTAQCSESTGTSSAPGVARARCTTGTAGDEGLLVGQRQALAGLQRGQGDAEPGEADHPVDADVGERRDGGKGLRAGEHLRPRRHRRLEGRGVGRVADGHHLGAPAPGLLRQQVADDHAPSATTS